MIDCDLSRYRITANYVLIVTINCFLYEFPSTYTSASKQVFVGTEYTISSVSSSFWFFRFLMDPSSIAQLKELG